MMFTEDELNWLRNVLSDSSRISPSYFYREKMIKERNKNQPSVREELDKLITQREKFTPQQLIGLRTVSQRKAQRVNNFSGIYIIHNKSKSIYYVGKAEKVFNRAYNHFIKDSGNMDIYTDFILGDEFQISLIPLDETSSSTLNELEGNAIVAYNSFRNGYNKVEGNILDRPVFYNEDHEEAAHLILNKIKELKEFAGLTNDRKRLIYIKSLMTEYKLPNNIGFQVNLRKLIKNHKPSKKNI